MYMPVAGGMVIEVGVPAGETRMELALARTQGTDQTVLARAFLNVKELKRLIRELEIQLEFLQDDTIV